MIKVQENELKSKLGDLFNSRSSDGITNNQELKKFKSVWNLIDNFDPDNSFDIPMEDQLRRFLSLEGDCKHYKYIKKLLFMLIVYIDQNNLYKLFIL